MDITKGIEKIPFKHHLDEVEEKRRKRGKKEKKRQGKEGRKQEYTTLPSMHGY